MPRCCLLWMLHFDRGCVEIRRYVQPGPPVQQLGPTPPGGLPAANPGATVVNAAIIAAAQAAADSLAGKVSLRLTINCPLRSRPSH